MSNHHNVIIILVVVICLAAGFLFGLYVGIDTNIFHGGYASLPSSFLSSSHKPSVSVPADIFLVTRVIDGDTIELEGGVRVRYIGVDTPESADLRRPITCFGREATGRNRELVEGRHVRLERDISNTDRFGRLLRYVWVGDRMINLQLVREGYAHASTYPPDISRQESFRSAEDSASKAGLGLWGSCPIKRVQRGFPPAVADGTEGRGCVIKGNINASGEKIYHLPRCPYYARAVIDITGGERIFCTEAEAKAAGWRKAEHCP